MGGQAKQVVWYDSNCKLGIDDQHADKEYGEGEDASYGCEQGQWKREEKDEREDDICGIVHDRHFSQSRAYILN